jgi:hypothetical protein
MRKGRMWVGIAGAGLALGLTAQTSGAVALSKAAFIAAADKICTAGSKKIEVEASKVFSKLGANDEPTETMMRTFVSKAVPILRAQIKDLRKLTPPKADQATIKKLFDDVDAATTKLAKDPKLMMSDTLFASVDKRAVAYGFKACGG